MTTQELVHFDVDPLNPGQFFACCALLELASRLWTGVEGAFDQTDRRFLLKMPGSRVDLMSAIANAKLEAIDPEDLTSTPIRIGEPFRSMDIDWWINDQTGARDFKLWKGQMRSYEIAVALQTALRSPDFHNADTLNRGVVVKDPNDQKKKREPYYFDSRRAPNAHARDVGFSTDEVDFASIAHPAVELLCLVGLQTARPASTHRSRIYRYFTWHHLMPSSLLLALASNAAELPNAQGYEFENSFRSGHHQHKSFRAASLVSNGE
jgi:CRISPR-associated protein Csb3